MKHRKHVESLVLQNRLRNSSRTKPQFSRTELDINKPVEEAIQEKIEQNRKVPTITIQNVQ